MRVLVAHASKHGATAGIAEHIGATLSEAGHEVRVLPVTEAGDVTSYDAVVVGGATYVGHWRKDATAFVEDHRDELAARPVWLFSSGPIGADKTDKEGKDLRTVSKPQEMDDLVAAVRPRGQRVFFGALDPHELTVSERLVRKLPAGRDLLPEGDFRDWDDVDGWSAEIVQALGAAGSPAAV
jgi:menaquinone-dependent protoporphyrinogen oxidase